jgi:hypothetical protein
MDTPGWTRTSGLCRRRTALCPLSYGRVQEPPAGVEPAPRPYKGRVLAVDTTEAKVETAGLESRPRRLCLQRGRCPASRGVAAWAEPASSRCKRGALPVELRPQRVRTGGFEPPQPEAAGLQPVELANAPRPREGWPTGFEPAPRGSRPRNAAVTPQPPRGGDDRTRTGGLSLDRRALCSSELRPQRVGRRDWLPATGGRVIARTSISGASCCPSALLPARVRAATSSPVGHGGLTKPAAR